MSKLGVGTVLVAIVIGTLVGVVTSTPSKTAEAVTAGAVPQGEPVRQDSSSVDHKPQETSAPAGARQSLSIADAEWGAFVDSIQDTHKQYLDDLASRSSVTLKLLAEWQQFSGKWEASEKDADSKKLLDHSSDRVFRLHKEYQVIESNFCAHVESLDQLVSTENAAVDRRQIVGDVHELLRKCNVFQVEFRSMSERLANEITGKIHYLTDVLAARRGAKLAELEKAKRLANIETEDLTWQLDGKIQQTRTRMQSYRETISTVQGLMPHDVHGKLRAIENLSYKVDHLCDRLDREVNVLRTKQQATPEWRSFQSKKAMNLLEEIAEAAQAVENAAEGIIVTRPSCCPHRR